MAAPFYLLFLPLFMLVGGVMLALYIRITTDPDCHLKTKIKSDLQEAQELDMEEEQQHPAMGGEQVGHA